MLRISRADLAEMQGNLNGNQDIVRAAKARGIDLNLLLECGCAYVEMVERQAQEARESAAREQAAAEEARLARRQEHIDFVADVIRNPPPREEQPTREPGWFGRGKT